VAYNPKREEEHPQAPGSYKLPDGTTIKVKEEEEEGDDYHVALDCFGSLRGANRSWAYVWM